MKYRVCGWPFSVTDLPPLVIVMVVFFQERSIRSDALILIENIIHQISGI